MTTINATNMLYAARAKHKRSQVHEREGKRLPDREFAAPKGSILVDHRSGVFLRK